MPGNAFRRLILATLLAAATFAVVRATADPGAQDPAPAARASFAPLIPPEANFYLEVRRLLDLEASLVRTRAAALLPMLVGRPAPMSDTTNLRQSVSALVGIADAAKLEQVMGCEAAYCAASWRDLEGAVLLIRAPDEDRVNEWFPPGVRSQAARKDKVLTFETGPLRIATRDRVVIVARRAAPASLFGRIAALLAEKKPAGWSSDPVFRRLAASGPARPLLLVGLRRPAAEPVGAGGLREWDLGFETAVVAIDERDGEVELTFRAKSTRTQRPEDLSRSVLDLVRRLPSSTLLAWATTADLKKELVAWTGTPDEPPQDPVLRLIHETLPAQALLEHLLPKLGRRSVFVWGRPSAARPSIPQLALFVECREASAAARELTGILASAMGPAGDEAAGGMGAHDGAEPPDSPDATEAAPHEIKAAAGPSPVRIRLGDDLGIPITTLVWPASQTDVNLGAHVQASLTPSFAPVDDWLVIALSEDHLRALIESHHAMRPGLEMLRDSRALLERPARSSTLAVAQPALAASVLSRWLIEYQAGRESPFDPTLWLGAESLSRLPRIGATVTDHAAPGVVRIGEVPEGVAAAGRLEPDDRILGVDGQLLALERPREDLRRRLLQSRRALGPVLRVDRGGAMLDVELPIKPSEASTPMERAIPTLRHLAVIGQRLDFACFRKWEASPDEYGAQLTLRFPKPAP